MINTNNIQRAILEVRAKKDTIVKAQDPAFNRKILESSKNITLVSPESQTKPTTIREIDSGLNHVMAKIASKSNNAIGIDLAEITLLSKKEKALRLEKVMQNIRICRKHDARLATNLASSSYILLSLGASTNQLKSTVTQSF